MRKPEPVSARVRLQRKAKRLSNDFLAILSFLGIVWFFIGGISLDIYTIWEHGMFYTEYAHWTYNVANHPFWFFSGIITLIAGVITLRVL